jgi:exodeoxyribonuclease V alpha subunit
VLGSRGVRCASFANRAIAVPNELDQIIWVIDPRHGQQFKAEHLQTTHPASSKGIEKYLSSGIVKGIGPKLAPRIVAAFKQRTLEVLDNSPDFLLHIEGIGRERLKLIQKSWCEQKEVRKIMLFLAEHGITPGRAVRIFRSYGQSAIAKIKENPYQLADDIRGIGFQTADELAARLGIERNSPHRARAAIRYALHELAGEGHCGYPEAGAVQQTLRLVDIDQVIVEVAINTAVQDRSLIREDIEGEPWLYLAGLFRAETGVAKSVRRIASASPHPLPAIDVEKALPWVEQRLGIQLAESQQEAIRQACQHKMLVITGGPGVGKTTLVRSILEIFSAKKLKCVLAASTGRAAKRLAETTGQMAKTIHRLLEFDPNTGEFNRNQDNPLQGDLFVLDETSMVDVVLGHQFLQAVPSEASVILVGDVDQLPSVGPGAVLGDLIASEVVPVVRLTEIFRQAKESRIIAAAYDINRGQIPDLAVPEVLGDFYFVEAEDEDTVQDLLVRLVKDRIPARFGFDPQTEIQVLSPMNRAALGSKNLNQLLQAALNPASGGPEVQRFGWSFRVGDRVIQIENNYDREVFNGDLGVIRSIDLVDQSLSVAFDDKVVRYEFNDLDELALAYVLSIHKSQGSEFPCVVITLHTQHYMMLRRNLLYTAVTRGKKLVILLGSKKALGIAARRADVGQRYTALRQRLVDTRFEADRK